MTSLQRPLIAHVVFRFAVGGMENGLVNLINRFPVPFADHCVIALTEVSPEFTRRVTRSDVRYVALNKPPGQTLRILPRIHRLFRALRPAIVHTRNVATLETQVAAWAAGVPVRIHGEHGWDTGDLVGSNRRLLAVRRLMRHFVHHQIALSMPTLRYLTERVGVAPEDATQVHNGVDTDRFSPAEDRARAIAALHLPGLSAEHFLVGTVGRLAPVKNQRLLLEAFAHARQRDPGFAARGRLVIVGDGPDRPMLEALADQYALRGSTHFAGERNDVPDCMRGLDLFCLPSLAEGISNAILEAMACGVPVAATDVGGNGELVEDGVTGALVPPGDVEALSGVIRASFDDSVARARQSRAARRRAVTQFSMEAMVDAYHRIYARQLSRAGLLPGAAGEGRTLSSNS